VTRPAAEELTLVDPIRGLGRRIEALPHLFGHEPDAHPVLRIDIKFLPLVALGSGELRVVGPERQASEHNVTGLVSATPGAVGVRHIQTMYFV
jgi:hypothetical protein